MVATLPGRTHGLGLITEPLLAELDLSRHAYAQINLWATLLGAAACLPVGAWLDGMGLRKGALILLPALALVVGAMSWIATPGWLGLFGLVLLTRAFGQSALSVLSLAVAGRAFKQGSAVAAGSYSLLLSMLFATAFYFVGTAVAESGWRMAWGSIAVGLVVLMPISFLLRPGITIEQMAEGGTNDLTLQQCLRIPAFWAYCAGIAAFAALSSGIGLFNQALLAERGFSQEVFVKFQSVSFIIALLGQIFCGVGTRWMPIRYWLGGALIVQAAALTGYQLLRTESDLWVLAAISGTAGGIIMVAFYAIWSDAFGKRHLGRIQGMAQMCTVVASALGPVLLEWGHSAFSSYAVTLIAAAPACLIIGLMILFLKPRREA